MNPNPSEVRDGAYALAGISSESELGRILALSLNEIYVFDAETLTFILVSRGARENLGYTLDELLKLTPVDIKPRFDRARFESQIAPLRSGQSERLHFETVQQRKDGSNYDIEVSLQLDTFHGRPAFVATILDITSRNLRETSLNESEGLSKSILETAVIPILTINEDCTIISANPATEAVFGYTLDEMIGQKVSILMPQVFRDKLEGYVADYLRTGERKIIGTAREVAGRRKDGSVFPMDLSVGEVIRPGKKRLFTGIIRDLTERKELENQLLTVSESERRSIGREIHDDLCQRFFGVGCLVEVLQAQAGELPDEIQQGLSELSRLVKEANARARQMSHGLMPVALVADGLMGALRELADSTVRSSGIRCEFRCDEPVLIENDNATIQLFRIAQEAVANAVKHGSPKCVEISLNQTAESLVLEIRDNGIGLPDNTDSTKGMGFLTMSHRARTLGGTCDIRSQEGTIVTCSIPTAILQAEPSGRTFSSNG